METGGMLSFTLGQRQALALLCIRIATMIACLFIGFYGTASMIRGYLIFRSGFLPRALGVLMQELIMPPGGGDGPLAPLDDGSRPWIGETPGVHRDGSVRV